MFTGIVEELGEVVSLQHAADGGSARLAVRGPLATSDAAHGDSIAINGVCLTVVDLSSADDGIFAVDVMPETLAKTTVGGVRPGDPVNLERSVTPATRLGGHVMQGHVDGVGRVSAYQHHDRWDDVTIEVPRELGRYIAPKGAIAVHGISLTVIEVIDRADGTEFTLGIIPETRTATTMGSRSVGDHVNIEVDVMAKYVERLLSATRAGTAQSPHRGTSQPKEHA